MLSLGFILGIAIMICGIELIEKYTKYIIEIKIKKGKEIFKRMKYIYESL